MVALGSHVTRFVVAASLALACGAPAIAAPTPAPVKPKTLPARPDVAAKLATIKPGMTADQVRAKLGAPDDILTEADPGGISATRTVEVWRYGARAHRAFATLGTVHMKADRTVQYVFGGKGVPVPGFDEAELRALLEKIAAVPSYNDTLEPRSLIAAVNALVPLGKPRAIAVIDEFLRVSSQFDDPGREGVFLLDRALFDVPASGMPPMLVGAAAMPKDPKALPRFPLAIVDDIPLKLVNGYTLGGHPQQPESDVDWFRAKGTMRTAPLKPPVHPLEVIDAFVERTLPSALAVDDNLRVYLYEQALRLVGTAFRPASISDGWFPYHGGAVSARWAAVRKQVAAIDPRWDAANRYVRPDGSVLPPLPTYQRVWWDVPLAGTHTRVTLERLGDDTVALELRFELKPAVTIAPGKVHIVNDAGTPVADLEFKQIGSPANSTSSYVSGLRMTLPRSTRVHLSIIQASVTTPGPTLTP